VYRRAGLHLERRPRRLRQRQPVRARHRRRPGIPPGQGNNAYIFPGIGLGALVAGARHITDAMFLLAARTLAQHVQQADLNHGALYPRLPAIRAISRAIGTAIAEEAYRTGLATVPKPNDVEATVKGYMYDPVG
jgi:malate dehydrogenase (oxaloacetate-decarboxylating)(NADP+)